MLRRGLPSILLVAAALACGCGGGSSSTGVDSPAAGGTSTTAPGHRSKPAGPAEVARRRLGLPALPANSPLPGYLMIADRDNNRIIVVSPDKKIVWRFPRPGGLPSGQSFTGPDDAFLTPSGRSIITNEEFADTIAIVRLSNKHPRISFEYGHADAPGSSPGYLSHPDDAYLLPNGLISVADIINCRVLFIDRHHHVVRSIGQAGDCSHDPPHSLLQPNGDTPTPDGGVLITEIGGWIDRLDRKGHLMWSIQTPTTYPSDAQLLPNGNVLVAGFDDPGHIYVITPEGHVIWTYGPDSGSGLLNKPSLAVPIGGHLIAATDDYGQRIVVIDQRTKHIVWQYGHLDQQGSSPGYLNKPDGLDLVK